MGLDGAVSALRDAMLDAVKNARTLEELKQVRAMSRRIFGELLKVVT